MFIAVLIDKKGFRQERAVPDRYGQPPHIYSVAVYDRTPPTKTSDGPYEEYLMGMKVTELRFRLVEVKGQVATYAEEF